MKKDEENIVEEQHDILEQSNEGINNVEKEPIVEDKKDEVVEHKVSKRNDKVLKGLLIVLAVSLIVGVFIGLGLMLEEKLLTGNDNSEAAIDEKDENEQEEDNTDEKDDEQVNEENDKKEENLDYVSDSSFVKISSLTGVSKLYAVDVNAGNDVVKYSGYDGYYLTIKDNDYYLKRNQKEVSKIERNTLKIYKDNSDENSKNIAVYCSDYCMFATAVSDEYAYLGIYNSDYRKSIIFNIDTGDHKIFDDVVNPVSGIDKVIFTHESISDAGTVSIISLNDFSLKSPKDVFIIGDGARLSQGDKFYSSSTKYIVVKNIYSNETGKYGLYDYQMNEKIGLIYDDLNTVSDDLLIAKKGEKFGVIDSSNKILVDFIYDGIEVIDNYYVAIKDGKLGVLDKDGKEVVPFNYSVPKDMKFKLRLCCGDDNSFSVSKRKNKILISYYDADKPLSGYRDASNISFIVLYEDGTYSKVEYNDKIYNYSEEFYYYSNSGFDLNIYDSNKNIYKTFTCDEYIPMVVGFADKDVLQYYCGTETHYYNVKLDKEVLKTDLKELRKESISFLYIYTIDGVKGVYNSKNKLLLKLDNNDSFRHVHDNIYKLTKENGVVEYYQY